MGGTIRLITQQPSLDEAYGSVHSSISSVTDGDINYLVDGSVNIPVVEDKFALRIAAYTGSNSGIYDRIYDPTWVNFATGQAFPNPAPAFGKNEDTDDEDFFGGQIFGKWQVTDTFSISPRFMYQKSKRTAYRLPTSTRKRRTRCVSSTPTSPAKTSGGLRASC